MKKKLIELYKTVLNSNKTIVDKVNYYITRDHSGVFASISGLKLNKNDDNILAKAQIVKVDKNEEFVVETGIFEKKKWDHPEDIYGIGIAFAGNIPNLMVYMSVDSNITRDEEVLLNKSKLTLFGKRIRTIEKDINEIYYLKFGSVYEKLEESEYRELIKYAQESIDSSHDKIADKLIKEFKKK